MQDEDRYEGMRKEKRGPGTQHLVYIGMEWHLRNVCSTRTLTMFAGPVQANTPPRQVLEKFPFYTNLSFTQVPKAIKES